MEEMTETIHYSMASGSLNTRTWKDTLTNSLFIFPICFLLGQCWFMIIFVSRTSHMMMSLNICYKHAQSHKWIIDSSTQLWLNTLYSLLPFIVGCPPMVDRQFEFVAMTWSVSNFKDLNANAPIVGVFATPIFCLVELLMANTVLSKSYSLQVYVSQADMWQRWQRKDKHNWYRIQICDRYCVNYEGVKTGGENLKVRHK